MNNIEAGRSKAGAETLAALCALFETSPAQMLAAIDAQSEPEPAPIKAQLHPGVEALAADAQELRRHHVTDEDLSELRQLICSRPIQTVQGAVMILTALRGERPA